jgi:hypothetical protein
VKGFELVIVHQFGGAKPTQQCVEIGQKLLRLTILDRTRIQEIQGQVIADEEETVLPVVSPVMCTRGHSSNYNTDNETLYRLAHLMQYGTKARPSRPG